MGLCDRQAGNILFDGGSICTLQATTSFTRPNLHASVLFSTTTVGIGTGLPALPELVTRVRV